MISVCMATYNGETYLLAQIESILEQLDIEDELIISDDGSIDKTLQLLEQYKDNRIKIIHNSVKHGVNGNFDNAIRHAKGDIIFLSDQDDIWLPGKVNACCKALENCDCVVHDAIIVDENLLETANSFFSERHSGNGFFKNIIMNTYLGCCMAFHRKILDICLPIPITKAFFHDNWIGCIADIKYKLKFIPYKGILFRRHSDNTSYTAKKSHYSFIRQLKNRLIQLKYVICRIYKSKIIELRSAI